MSHKTYSSAQEIRVAVVGYGGAFNMGKSHLDQMKAAGMVPTAVVEIDPTRIEIASLDFPGIRTHATLTDLLTTGEIDLVTIITPHNTHAELAQLCLNAGCHVICEKPLAITTAECDEMIAAAEKNGCLLSTFHNRHWDGCILEAVDRIRNKQEIGRVFRVEARMGHHHQPGDWWRSSKSISGGMHYDWGVHFLEYALQLIDSDITEVSAFAQHGFWKTRWNEDTNEDEVSLIVRFANGTSLNVCITALDHDNERQWFKICGTEGTYFMNHQEFEIVRQQGNETIRHKGRNRPANHQLYYDNIAAALTGQAELIITPQWSRRPIHILDLATQSSAQAKALPAVYP